MGKAKKGKKEAAGAGLEDKYVFQPKTSETERSSRRVILFGLSDRYFFYFILVPAITMESHRRI